MGRYARIFVRRHECSENMKINSVRNYNCSTKPRRLSNAALGVPVRTSASIKNNSNPYYLLALASLRDKKIESELKLMGLI